MSVPSALSARRVRNSTARSGDAAAPAKRPVNLSLSVDVLDEARRLGFNVSQMCDAYLREQVRRERERRWREENAAFLAAYNAQVQDEGLPLQDWQRF